MLFFFNHASRMSRNDTSSHTLIKQLYKLEMVPLAPHQSFMCRTHTLASMWMKQGTWQQWSRLWKMRKSARSIALSSKALFTRGRSFLGPWLIPLTKWGLPLMHWRLGAPKNILRVIDFYESGNGHNLKFHNLKIFEDCSNTAYIIIIIPQV